MKRIFLIVAIILTAVITIPTSAVALAETGDTVDKIEINSEGVVIPFPDLDADWVYRIKIFKDGEEIAQLNHTSYVFGFGEYVIEYHAENLVTDERRIISKQVEVVDTTAPVIETAEFRVNYTTGSTVNFGCVVTDNSGEELVADIKVKKDGTDITSQIKEGRLTLSSKGSYSVTFQATDSSGNASRPIEYQFTVTGDDVVSGGWYIYLIIGVAAALAVCGAVVAVVVVRRKKHEKE